jgi:hypothetical protein
MVPLVNGGPLVHHILAEWAAVVVNVHPFHGTFLHQFVGVGFCFTLVGKPAFSLLILFPIALVIVHPLKE